MSRRPGRRAQNGRLGAFARGARCSRTSLANDDVRFHPRRPRRTLEARRWIVWSACPPPSCCIRLFWPNELPSGPDACGMRARARVCLASLASKRARASKCKFKPKSKFVWLRRSCDVAEVVVGVVVVGVVVVVVMHGGAERTSARVELCWGGGEARVGAARREGEALSSALKRAHEASEGRPTLRVEAGSVRRRAHSTS